MRHQGWWFKRAVNTVSVPETPKQPYAVSKFADLRATVVDMQARQALTERQLRNAMGKLDAITNAAGSIDSLCLLSKRVSKLESDLERVLPPAIISGVKAETPPVSFQMDKVRASLAIVEDRMTIVEQGNAMASVNRRLQAVEAGLAKLRK